MIRTLAILCLAASSAYGIWEKDLRLRCDMEPSGIGSTAFMPMPTTVSEATTKGWEKMEPPELPAGYEKLEMYCPLNDYTVCLFYDDDGNLAGLQLAFQEDKLKGALYDWATSGFVDWQVTKDDVTTNYHAIYQFYISTDYLALLTADRVRDENYIVQGDYLYVRGFNGKLFTMPTDMAQLKASTIYKQQACTPGMGNHYYYNMTTDLPCTAETMFAWFPMEYDDQLIGAGFLIPGKYTAEEGKLYPFEDPDRATIEAVVPYGPECFWAYGDSPGVTSMHIYFIKEAYLTTCDE